MVRLGGRTFHLGKLTVRLPLRYLHAIMTAVQVYESVTDGGTGDFADLISVRNCRKAATDFAEISARQDV